MLFWGKWGCLNFKIREVRMVFIKSYSNLKLQDHSILLFQKETLPWPVFHREATGTAFIGDLQGYRISWPSCQKLQCTINSCCGPSSCSNSWHWWTQPGSDYQHEDLFCKCYHLFKSELEQVMFHFLYLWTTYFFDNGWLEAQKAGQATCCG